ncbi:MAG: FHIPEP family type III secretion protein, partial [Hyphomicrobiales bacterium]
MTSTVSPHEQAKILSEALPHMQRYDDATVVVKYGGHAMGDEASARMFARDIVLLEQAGINPIVVHGGGPQISEMLKRLGIKSEFAAGHRITDQIKSLRRQLANEMGFVMPSVRIVDNMQLGSNEYAIRVKEL